MEKERDEKAELLISKMFDEQRDKGAAKVKEMERMYRSAKTPVDTYHMMRQYIEDRRVKEEG